MDLSRHYISGEPILPGDCVTFARRPARIVFVLGVSAPGEAMDTSWYLEELKRGFMLEQDGGWYFQHESDEDLALVRRGGEA